MFKGKSWAMFAACAVVATGSLVRAESETPASTLSLTKPISAQAAPGRKPLMWLLDQGGLAKPLEDVGITIGGYASASTTFYADKAGASGGAQPGRLFDTEDQDPTLNALNAYVEKTVDLAKHEWDIGFRVEALYGGDARFIHATGLGDYQGFNDGPDEQFDLFQAYGVLATPWDLKFTIGKFATPAGYETVNATTTPLYSRGLLFTYMVPRTHTGVVATYVWGDWTFDGGIIRGWDDALEDKNNDGVAGLGRVSYMFPDKKTNLSVTATFGPEYPNDNTDNRLLVDAVLTHKFSDEWSFAFEGDWIWESDVNGNVTPGDNNSDDAWAGGLGAWATYTASQYFQFNGRAEYLYDGQGIRTVSGFASPTTSGFVGGPPDGTSVNLYSAALGVTITPFPTNELGSNLKIRPEVRADYSDSSTFFGGAEDNWQFSAGIEGYFTF